MPSPTTSLLTPSLRGIPSCLPLQGDGLEDLSNYYHAIGYACDGLSPLDHCRSVLRERFKVDGIDMFRPSVDFQLGDGFFRTFISGSDFCMLVFREEFLSDPLNLQHFWNLVDDPAFWAFFQVASFAEISDAVARCLYVGHETIEDFREFEPDEYKEWTEEHQSDDFQDIIALFRGRHQSSDCSVSESLEFFGLDPKFYQMLSGLARKIDTGLDSPDCDIPEEPVLISSFGQSPHRAEWEFLESCAHDNMNSYGHSVASTQVFRVEATGLEAAQQVDQTLSEVHACCSYFWRFFNSVVKPFS